jgi:hypothetical protein
MDGMLARNPMWLSTFTWLSAPGREMPESG